MPAFLFLNLWNFWFCTQCNFKNFNS